MAEQLDIFGADPCALPTRWKYMRRAVPAVACDRALRALRAYNEATGSRLGAFRFSGAPSDALTRITGAVLDHPEVSEWEPVITAALRDPWWSGPPSVGVIFGPGVVDRNITAASAPPTSTPTRLTSNGALLRALGA